MFPLIVASAVLSSDLSTSEANRLREAATVLEEIQSGPDKDIPQELWDRAECVIVVPGLKKAAFVIGGEYGKGLMSCKHEAGWSRFSCRSAKEAGDSKSARNRLIWSCW